MRVPEAVGTSIFAAAAEEPAAEEEVEADDAEEAEVDAEVERAKQLTAGMAAEEAVQLPPKDVDALVKKADKQKELEQKGYELRATHEGLDDDSRPRPRHAAPEA